MVWEVVTPPNGEPVDLDRVRADLRIDADNQEEDELLTELISEVRQFLELTCNRAMLPQTWRAYLPAFGDGLIRLSGGPFRAIDSIKYYDPDDALQTLDPSDYRAILAEPARLQAVNAWPATSDRIDAVEIRASVGYVDAANVPGPLRRAIRALVAHHFVNREPVVIGSAVSELPLHVEKLIFPYRDGSTL